MSTRVPGHTASSPAMASRKKSRIFRNKEHFQGLLSEILKQNSNIEPKFSPSSKFIEQDVEQRSLSIYDALSEEVRK